MKLEEFKAVKVRKPSIRKTQVNIRPHISPSQRQQLVHVSGSQCSLANCKRELAIGNNAFIGEVAFIQCFMEPGARYNPDTEVKDLMSQDNLILLCPTCHRLVDKQPEVFTSEWLKDAKRKHLKTLQSAISSESPFDFKLDGLTEISLKEAIGIWENNRENSSEEFWQQLLTKSPAVLSQVFPNSSFQFGSKNYVGGKNINNKQGNLVDFIYASKHTDNIVMVEIKTPAKDLLGPKYRGNAYSISDELSGGIVQVLNYKEQLLKEYYKLKDDDSSFNAFSPKCVVLIGDLEREMNHPIKIKSLELFRGSLSGVLVITYDELFEKAKDVLALIS
jgi:hypothetical protein